MPEKHNIEWKESWKDEYLKTVVAFANTSGGKIYIGINDKGEIIGVKNSKKLLEDIPNKIQVAIGIIANVKLRLKKDKEYIEITIKASSYPVSYRGIYFIRSGSTTQQLIGSYLTEFLLSKTGIKWDSLPVNSVRIKDLDKESFDIFKRESVRNKRMLSQDVNVGTKVLLEKLGLLKENNILTRAAVMLFYKEQDRIFTGCYVKIIW